jgi:hypothetical protein
MSSMSSSAEPASCIELEQVAFLGSLLSMLSVRELMGLRRMNTRWRGLASSPQFWAAMAHSLAGEHALYTLEPTRTAIAAAPEAGSAWRRHFLEQLWPARDKWRSSGGGDGGDARAGFSIQVSVRFRPGPRSNRGLALPLHQFLRVRREQEAVGGGRGGGGGGGGGGGSGGGDELAGGWLASMTPPARFLDPLLGHVMRDPVVLPRCGTIVDRASLLSHARMRGPVSPIDGLSCDPAACEDAAELRRDIDAWRARASAAHAAGNEVGLDAAHALIESMGENLPPEVLRALQEAAVLRDIAKAALCSAAATAPPRRGARVLDIDGDDSFEDGVAEADDESTAAAAGTWQDEVGHAHGGGASGSAARRTVAAGGEECAGGRQRRGDAGRVLSIGPHRVVAFIEGSGIRPFDYARVHGGRFHRQRPRRRRRGSERVQRVRAVLRADGRWQDPHHVRARDERRRRRHGDRHARVCRDALCPGGSA